MDQQPRTGRRPWVPAPFGPAWLRNWLERHQHPFSFWIHMLGIPLTLLAIPALYFDEYLWAAMLFIGGYALQFLGHAVEGNDAGEWCAVKRLFGLPYVAISPRWQSPKPNPGT